MYPTQKRQHCGFRLFLKKIVRNVISEIIVCNDISEKIVRNGILDKNRIERLLLRLKSQDQRFSDYISGPEIAVDLSQVTLNIRGIAHFPQVLPNYGFAGSDIEDCKIRENVAIADQVESCLEKVRHISKVHRVCNEDF